MKLYTINFNYNQPVPQKFTISTNTNFLIGVKATRNGLPVEIDPTEAVLIAKNGNQTHADEVLTNGYVTFQMGTTDTPYYTEYGLDVNGDEVRDFKIMLNVVKGDIGDIDTIGMTSVTWDDIQDKPDVLTPSSSEITELDSTVSALSESFGQLDSTVSELALSVGDVDAKVEELDSTVSALSEDFGELDSTLSGLVDSLSSYATTSAMESYVSTATSNFVTASEVDSAISTATSTFVDATQVEGIVSAATSEFQTATQVSNAISAATSNKVTGGKVGSAPALLSAVAIYETDWATLSSTANENTMYVVLPDPVVPATTKVKYTSASGLPDWVGDIEGTLNGSKIPNNGQMSELEIGTHVTYISDGGFSHNSSLTKITIPNSVTGIGNMAFYNCPNLMDVTMFDRTMQNVRGMLNYAWSLPSGCKIHCTDGDITR